MDERGWADAPDSPVVWRPAGQEPTAFGVTRDVVMATMGGRAGAFGGTAGPAVVEAIDREIAAAGRWLDDCFVLALRLPLSSAGGAKRSSVEGLGVLAGPPGTFDGAGSVYVLLATAGAELEAEVTSRFARGEVVGGMALDAVGTVLVGLLVERFLDEAEREVPIGLSLQPGCHHLPMVFQKRIFTLLGAECYGMAITDSLMLRPTKSVTSVVPAGKDLVVRRGRVPLCDLCSMRERCQYRVFEHLDGGGHR